LVFGFEMQPDGLHFFWSKVSGKINTFAAIKKYKDA